MPAPANDNYADAQVLTGTSGSTAWSTVDATSEDALEYYVYDGFTIYYQFTAPEDGTLAVTVDGPTEYSGIAAWVGLSGPPLYTTDTPVLDAYGGSFDPYTMALPVTAGDVYTLQLDSATGTTGTLDWAFIPPPTGAPLGIGDAAVGVDYVYVVHNAVDGTVLGEIPLSVQEPFTRLLSGCGELRGTLPLSHPKATKALLGPQDREISVWRNGDLAWHGPITYTRASLADAQVQLGAREPSWYLLKRTIEDDQNWTEDVFDIVRAIVDYATGAAMKTNGALYNFTVSSGAAGVSRTWGLVGDDRDFALNAIDDLAAHPTVGFDYRMDISGTFGSLVSRHLTLGAPNLGTTILNRILEPGGGLYDLIDEADLERAGNRTHTRPGDGAPTSLDNTGQLTAGRLLLEAVQSLPNLTATQVVDIAQEFRRNAQPPVENYVASYVPRAALPFGWCDLGDLVKLHCDVGYLTVDASRRVKAIGVLPPQKEQHEKVDLTLALPLDETGA